MYVCCIRKWPLPMRAFQDQCRQTMIIKYSKQLNKVKNCSWQEASVDEKLNSGLIGTHLTQSSTKGTPFSSKGGKLLEP